MCFGLVLSGERPGQLFTMLSGVIRQINKEMERRRWQERNEKESEKGAIRNYECALMVYNENPSYKTISSSVSLYIYLFMYLSFLYLPAPEVVARHRYGRPVDCWAVGVIMYIL